MVDIGTSYRKALGGGAGATYSETTVTSAEEALGFFNQGSAGDVLGLKQQLLRAQRVLLGGAQASSGPRVFKVH